MLNLAIIGCGRLGSRHLESLSGLGELTRIFLVDPSQKSIDSARWHFFDSIRKHGSDRVSLADAQIQTLPDDLDIAIIATNSRERAMVVRELIEKKKPTQLILEKYLFPHAYQYHDIRTLVSETNAKVWVNQWMSSEYAFRRLASMFNASENITVCIDGDDWGLGCNAVHFIDFFDYLVGRQPLEVVNAVFDKKFEKSRRQGYVDITGRIEIHSEEGSILELVSSRSNRLRKKKNIRIKMTSCEKELNCIYDGETLAYIFDAGNVRKRGMFQVKLQSQRTKEFIERLITSGNCNLPTFDRSIYHHMLVHPHFEEYFGKYHDLSDHGIPIT
jgi:hypothetical protein